MGGNAVGIYVHDVQKNSIADLAGLKKGDQILEYNGVDLRRVTAESAATEISKPADNVTVLVQHNMTSELRPKKTGFAFVLLKKKTMIRLFFRLTQNSIKSKTKLAILCTFVLDSIVLEI